MKEKQLTHLMGNVDDIIYTNEMSGFCVISLETDDDLVTVTGNIGNVDEGEALKLTGEFIDHPRFGMQFKAELCEKSLPQTASTIKRYLASGVIKGIGPVMAKKIVDRFKDETLNILTDDPEKLLEIDGITSAKLSKIVAEVKKTFAVKKLMHFFSIHDLLPIYGVRMWHSYGENALSLIEENPYILCKFGIDLPFVKAEQLARNMGLPHDDSNRIGAGIASILLENSYEGHSCLPLDRLKETAVKYLEITNELFNTILEENISDFKLVKYKKINRDFIYLRHFYTAEKYIADRISVMRRYVYDNHINFDEVINIDEKQNDIKYGELQRKAINTALSKGLMILTGGPGTGKTTTLNAIISLFEQQGERVLICAPTGKAAKRISEITDYDAKTVHRLLNFKPGDNGELMFTYNETNPLECDVLVIDEMSMVDVQLFQALISALPLNAKMIMVGDSDQLPSVGAGNVLKDLIESNVVDVVKLTEIFRQAQKSAIVTNAHKIVGGEMPELQRKDSDFFFMQRTSHNAVAETVVELVSERLPKAYNYSIMNNIQVLTPSRIGNLGVVELNKKLQEKENPPAKDKFEFKTLTYTFRVNDKVMQTKNNYEIEWKKDDEKGTGIFNGDIGVIIHIDKSALSMKIDFDGKVCVYNSALAEHLELAYAITIHKSQGSEFDAVILPLFAGFSKLSYRNLLYTAVTRAKKLLIIVGSPSEVRSMVNNNLRTNRYTCLKNMLEMEDDDNVIEEYL